MKISFPATVFTLLVALWVKAIYPPSSGIADTDFYWHIGYGQWMLEHGSIPATDVFSWTKTGTPYQLTQWLGELIMGAFYNAWGLHGTKALSVLLTAITIGFAWAAARRYVHSSAALGIALLCNLVTIITAMRPQLFTFAMLSVISWIAAEWMTGGRRWAALLLVPLMALWVNLHGGYVVGIGFLGLMCLGLWYEAWRAGKLADRELILLSLICVAATAATLLNPYGIGAWEAVLMISGLRSSTVIIEWMPVNLTTGLGWFYLLNLVPFFALLVMGARPRPAHAILAGFFLAFGILANRQVPMCAAVMAPLTAALLAKTPQYRSIWATAAVPNRPVLFSVITLLLGSVFFKIQTMGDTNWERTINAQYPVRATQYMKEHGFTNKVLSDTLEASYLIYERIPVFVDGRMDLYRDDFYFAYYLASKGAPGWDALLSKYQPESMLLRNDMALRQLALASGNWKLAYEDDLYSVLRPAGDPLSSGLIPRDIEYLDRDGNMRRTYNP